MIDWCGGCAGAARAAPPMGPKWDETVKILPTLLFAALVFGMGSAAMADEVILKNGRVIEGDVVELPDKIRIRVEQGALTIQRDQVERVILKESWLSIYREKEVEVEDGSAGDHYRLGIWCRARFLARSAEAQLRLAIQKDPDHAGAHRALGHVFRDGEWMTKEEDLIRRGYTRYERRWISPEEQERLAAALEEEAEAEEPEVVYDEPFYYYDPYAYYDPYYRSVTFIRPGGGRGSACGPTIMFAPTLVLRPNCPPVPCPTLVVPGFPPQAVSLPNSPACAPAPQAPAVQAAAVSN